MRLRRLLAATVTIALAAPAGVLVTSGPAAAATPTKIAPSSGKSWLTFGPQGQPGPPAFGDSVYFSIDVVSTDGSEDPYAGTLKVERRLAGSKKWTTVTNSSYPGYSGSARAVANATYRATYSGGSSGDSSWAGSTATKTIKVQRSIDIKNVGSRKVVLAGKVGPKYRGKVAIFKKHGKRWKKFKTVRTNKKSKFRTPLPAPRTGRYYWNVRIGGSKKFAPSQTGRFYTYSYRSAAGRASIRH